MDKAYFWLSQVTGPNVVSFEQVKKTYPQLEEAHALAKSGRTDAFASWGEKFINRAIEYAPDAYLDERLAWLKENGVGLLPLDSEDYPELLKEIHHPPPLLYIKGRLPASCELPIAMVGMRKPSAYGEAVARHLSAELVKSGATVVSGMAMGIDSRAAQGALSVETKSCPTIAVLGCGVDVIYPPTNARLYDEIIERGAVISEFPPGTRPLRENFPIRNRVISGLARGVVVVEANRRSGTSITANFALDQGRDLFAVPGRITDENSVGPNGMIQRGEAKPIFCAADILVEYGIDAEAPRKAEPPDTSALGDVEKRIVEALMRGEKSADELCELLGLSIAEINSGLTSLQFSGIIKQLPGRVFGL